MARQHRLESSARATAIAAIFGVALLALPLACGSDSDNGDDDADSDRDEAPRTSEPAPRDPVSPAAEDAEPDPSADAEPDPTPTDDVPTPPNMSDESPAAPGASAGSSDGVPPAAASAFASCTRSEGSYGTNCDYVYVTMTRASAPRCVQLTIDNCDSGGYGLQGLAVDVPRPWQLSSAALGASADDCALGVFDPESTIVIGASGSIDFAAIASNDLPSGISLDVVLEPSTTADDTLGVDVVTSEPLNPARCED